MEFTASPSQPKDSFKPCQSCLKPRLLKADQAAPYLGTNKYEVYRLVRTGEIPCVLVGKKKTGIRIAKDDLDKWIDKNKKTC
jgi:excisionase family DNA binding protein